MLTKQSNTGLGDEVWQWIRTSSYNPSHKTCVIWRPPTKHQFKWLYHPSPTQHPLGCPKKPLKGDPIDPTLQCKWYPYSPQLAFLYQNNPLFWGRREEEWDGRRNWSKIPQQNQKKNTGLINHVPQTCRNPNNPARNKRYLGTWECTPKKWEFGLARNPELMGTSNRRMHKRTKHKCPSCLLHLPSSDGLFWTRQPNWQVSVHSQPLANPF